MKEFILLQKEFLRIKELGWIRSERKGSGGIGYTFESLLGKDEDDLELPDYYGIEIKTRRMFSKYPTTLFNMNPIGKKEDTYPIKSLLNKYGIPDTRYPDKNKFLIEISGNRYYYYGKNYKFKIKINEVNKRVELLIKDSRDNTINTDYHWDFEVLKERIETKLSKLALINAYRLKDDNIEYFRYATLECFKLKENYFEKFIMLLKEGKIQVLFNIGIYYVGNKTGEICNKGVPFRISEFYYDELFDRIIVVS